MERLGLFFFAVAFASLTIAETVPHETSVLAPGSRVRQYVQNPLPEFVEQHGRDGYSFNSGDYEVIIKPRPADERLPSDSLARCLQGTQNSKVFGANAKRFFVMDRDKFRMVEPIRNNGRMDIEISGKTHNVHFALNDHDSKGMVYLSDRIYGDRSIANRDLDVSHKDADLKAAVKKEVDEFLERLLRNIEGPAAEGTYIDVDSGGDPRGVNEKGTGWDVRWADTWLAEKGNADTILKTLALCSDLFDGSYDAQIKKLEAMKAQWLAAISRGERLKQANKLESEVLKEQIAIHKKSREAKKP